MYTQGDKGKEVVGDPRIRSTQPLLEFKIQNSLQKNFDVDPVDEESPEHHAKSPVRGLLDYFDPKMEEFILIEENLMTL